MRICDFWPYKFYHRRSGSLRIHQGIPSSKFYPNLEGKPVTDIIYPHSYNSIHYNAFDKMFETYINRIRNKSVWLTSKLTCPPMENVRLRWANFSRRMDTILGRILWTWNIVGSEIPLFIARVDHEEEEGNFLPCHTFQILPFLPGCSCGQLEIHSASHFGILWMSP